MTRLRFSANLGFLWNDLPLPDAIRRAKAAGFAAVECHWPYEADAAEVSGALAETGLPMLGINTVTGGAGHFGLSACPDRTNDARVAIEQAVAYAEAIDAQAIHIMAGVAEGPAARDAFLSNLQFAAGLTDRMLLIEPLNAFDVPGYFLRTTDQAIEVIQDLAVPNLRLMFDCYHVARSEGDVIRRLTTLLPRIGHIQIASVPERTAPDGGALDYQEVFATLRTLGWHRPIGAEYKPGGPTEASLGWLTTELNLASQLRTHFTMRPSPAPSACPIRRATL